MQEPEVARVDVALQALEPVAFAERLLDHDLLARLEIRLDVRQWRRGRSRPHVGPDDAVPLDARIRARPHPRLEGALLRLARHVDARALAVELPTVIGAPDALLLVAPEEERRATMRTVVLDEPHAARRYPEGDEVLAEEPDADRHAVDLWQLGGDQGGNPVFADEIAHGCP